VGNAHPDEISVGTHGQEPMHRGLDVMRVARDDGIIADDTRKRAAEVIRVAFGIVYHPTPVGRLLKALRWSRQMESSEFHAPCPLAGDSAPRRGPRSKRGGSAAPNEPLHRQWFPEFYATLPERPRLRARSCGIFSKSSRSMRNRENSARCRQHRRRKSRMEAWRLRRFHSGVSHQLPGPQA
jgi:Winged helix-turn helix